MKDFRDKVVLITGSTSGLGRELAHQLLRSGARVVINGRHEKKVNSSIREFEEEGLEPSGIAGDVTSPEDCKRMVRHCEDHCGGLDVLICNAGQGSGGCFADTTPETFRHVFEVNTLGSIYITRYALDSLKKSRGSVVFISSLAALVGLPYSSLYSSSKMALTAISHALRLELAGANVHVGIVYAGFLRNGPEKRLMGPDGRLQPLGERESFRLQPMEEASRKIIRMIRRRKNRLVLSTMGRMLYATLHFAPWLVSWVLSRSREKARRMYEPQTTG